MSQQSKLQITKVKCKTSENKIFIGYTRSSDNFTDVRTSDSDEQAAPEFYEKLKALNVHAGFILGFTQEQILSLTPHSVNYSYDKDKRMSAIISCLYETPSGKIININTPLLKCPIDDEEGKSAGFFTAKAVEALWDMELEARKYLDGKRAQVSLFGEEPGASSQENANAEDEEESDDDQLPWDETNGDADGFAASL